MEEKTREKINGTVENIVYKNDQTGFAVLDLDVNGELLTVVGELFGVTVGEELNVWGEYTTHPSFGSQFKAVAAERILPSSASAILQYLSNKAVNGIGPQTARRIVDSFKEDSLEVIANHPEKLCAIQGISQKKAAAISEEFKKIYGVRETLNQLAALGLETSDGLLLYRAYADYAVQLITDNPYMLCGYPLYKEFELADAIAERFGIEHEHVNRLHAGLVYVLRHNKQNGHTCLPSEALIDTVKSFLDVPRDAVEIALYDAVEQGTLCTALCGESEMTFLSDMMRAERYIAERLQMLNMLKFGEVSDAAKRIDEFEKRSGVQYEELQRKAIERSLTSGAVVITGGPGTGKTTTLNAIISLCEQNGDDVVLAAPTGRAAKRLSELTGREAKTIHRLLETDGSSPDVVKFLHDDNNPLKCDVVVVDEMSMVDVSLFEALLRGVRPQCRLILVGDFNQLPSVGEGNVLRDIISSGVCETIEFRKIFRQAAQSLIVVNAHRIVDGEPPDLETHDRDFFFLACEKEQGAKLVCDLAAARLPKAYGCDPLSDIQILTPSRKGLLGTATLNEALRARLNPHAKDKNEIKIRGQLFREGDRVMQIKNNYDIKWTRDGGEGGMGVYNGDIGVVENIDPRSMKITCIFDDRRVCYDFDNALQLEPAFAVTVHKSQGSEFPMVILAVGDCSPKLCYRNLLYTAVTRARKLLVIVGDRAYIEQMVANNRRMLRFTGLSTFLRGEGQ